MYATLLGMTDCLHIVPWADPTIDTLGHDPRSWYAETFWLPTIGPTCLLVLRRVADGFDRNPDGFVVDTSALSGSLGLGDQPQQHGPLNRALKRLTTFSLATTNGEGTLLVRRRLAPIHRKHVHRLPSTIRALHHDLHEADLMRTTDAITTTNARRLALRLAAAHESPDCAERALLHHGFSAPIARDAVGWATRALTSRASA